jgi:hypothetical protein
MTFSKSNFEKVCTRISRNGRTLRSFRQFTEETVLSVYKKWILSTDFEKAIPETLDSDKML